MFDFRWLLLLSAALLAPDDPPVDLTYAAARPFDGCLQAESFGASPDLKDNTFALRAAAAALPQDHFGCVSFGLGTFNFAQEVDLTLPRSSASLLIKGVGETMTRLNWGATNGLVIAQTSQYNTSHVRDLSITTSGSGAGVGLTFRTSANLGVLAVSDVSNVTFKGADGGKSANYWATAFKAHGTSYVNLVSDSFIGGETGTSGVGDFLGTGVVLEGGDAPGQYNIVDNVSGSNFQDLVTMLIYGPYVQGVTVDQTNFQNGGLAFASLAAKRSVLAELAVTNSQFGNLSTGVLKTSSETAVIDQLMFANNLFFCASGTTCIDLTNGFYFASFVGNTFSGNTSKDLVNGIIMGTSNSSNAVISDNIFSTFTTAINLLPTSSQVWVSGNGFYSTANPVLDAGTRNHVDFNLNDGARQITDDLVLRNHLNFSQSNKPKISCAGATSASLDIHASDSTGMVNVSGTTTGCTITFTGTGNSNRQSPGFTNPPRCVVSSSGLAIAGYQTTTRQLAVQPGSSVRNPVFTYICVGP